MQVTAIQAKNRFGANGKGARLGLLQDLRNAVQAGTASGPGLDALSVFKRLESKYKTMTPRSATDIAI